MIVVQYVVVYIYNKMCTVKSVFNGPCLIITYNKLVYLSILYAYVHMYVCVAVYCILYMITHALKYPDKVILT